MRRLIVFWALALAVGARESHAAPLPDAVPVETFAKLPELQQPRLSPDGLKMATKASVDGRQMLIVTSIVGDTRRRILDAGTADVNWWRWVNDDWLAVGLGDEQTYYRQPLYITRIAGVNASTMKVVPIDWYKSGIDADNLLWVARDGSPRIIFSKQRSFSSDMDWYQTVYEADVSTGKVRQVQSPVPHVFDWYTDAAGAVRLGVQEVGTERYSGILYRGAGEEHLSRIPVRKIGDLESLPLPKIYLPNGNAIAIDDHEGRAAVYEMQLPSFTMVRKIAGDANYDIDDLIPTADGTDLSGYIVTDHREHEVWLDPFLQDLQHGLDQTLGAANGRIVSWDRNRRKLLVKVGSASEPGAYFYWDTASAKMSRLAWVNPELAGRMLSPVKTVRYAARDRTQIEAVLTLPRGRAAKALPLLVMPHGGPYARDSEEYDWLTQYLAEQGYAVIQPNYRGSTGYGKAFEDLGKGEWGLKMQDDLLDAIDWAAKQGIADPKRVCIVGASYGGYAAMRGAQRDGSHYRCSASYAGVSDLKEMLRYDHNFFGKRSDEYWKEQSSNFDAVSPRFHANEFGAPILIVHGAKDRRVPIRQSQMLVEELQKAGKPFEYLEQKLGDHHFSRAEDRLEFLKALKAFLDKYNPA
jgi:dipeptidyl aminopeptidase/acylaminoacyl peptidase